MQEQIRVFLADDHAVLRSGLKLLLNAEEDVLVVGEAQDARLAIEHVAAVHPDVALIDLQCRN